MNNNKRTSTNNVITQKLSMIIAGVVISMTVASLAAGMDMLIYDYVGSITQASQMILWWAALAVPVGIVAGAIALGISSASRGLLPACVILSGLLGVALHFATALLFEDRNLLVTVPVPWIIAYGVCRWLAQGRGRAWLVRGLTIVALTAIWVPFAISAGVHVQRLTALIGWGMLLLAIAAIGQWIVAKRPKILLTIVILMVGIVQWQGQSLLKWHRNETGAPSSAVLNKVSQTTKPNVVLIVLDTTRADRLGCYGSDAGLTPNIDKLSSQGVRYSNAIASSSWTVPTHASLFTGYYLKTHGCGSDPHRWLDDGFVTLAEILGEAGYQTVALSSNRYVEAANLLQGFDASLQIDIHQRTSRFSTWIQRIGLPTSWADHGAATCVKGMAEWLSTDRDTEAPLYLFVNLMEAHWPYLSPAKWRADQLASDVSYWEATRAAHYYYGVSWFAGEPHTKREEEIVRSLYDAGVAYEDFQVGQMLKLLDQHIDMDNTIVIVTSDHGENLGEGGRWDHIFALNDKLIHVPLIVRYPPSFPAGITLEGQIQMVDIAPTVLDIVDLPHPEDDWPGRVITPVKYQPYEHTFAEVFPYYSHLSRMIGVLGLQRDVAKFSSSLRMVRTNRYKYVWSSRGEHALYDLPNDPSEARNIIAAYPEIAASLRTELDQWYDRTSIYVPRSKGLSPIDKEALENLKSLGYVGD